MTRMSLGLKGEGVWNTVASLGLWVLLTMPTAGMTGSGQLLDGSRLTFRLGFAAPLLGLRL